MTDRSEVCKFRFRENFMQSMFVKWCKAGMESAF